LFADYGRQYYVDSYIEGGVDFIFGNATAVFERTEIHSNGPGYLTAQSRTAPNQTTGYVIVNSRVTSGFESGNEALEAGRESERSAGGKVFLGRPWRPFSRVIYINTELDTNVNAEGWSAWKGVPGEPQAYYAEFNSKGPGANPKARVSWSHQLTESEASQYEPRVFLAGADHWDAQAEAAKLP
jgi:pectinesterase